MVGWSIDSNRDREDIEKGKEDAKERTFRPDRKDIGDCQSYEEGFTEQIKEELLQTGDYDE